MCLEESDIVPTNVKKVFEFLEAAETTFKKFHSLTRDGEHELSVDTTEALLKADDVDSLNKIRSVRIKAILKHTGKAMEQFADTTFAQMGNTITDSGYKQGEKILKGLRTIIEIYLGDKSGKTKPLHVPHSPVIGTVIIHDKEDILNSVRQRDSQADPIGTFTETVEPEATDDAGDKTVVE